FVQTAKDYSKGLFVLVRTSNPGSTELQDVKLEDGRTWSEMLADKLHAIASQPALVGTSGWSSIGAVVGATQEHTMQSIRRRLPQSFFLLPGYGAQGATAEMTRAAFVDGKGAIVSASRSILYPQKPPGVQDWQDSVTMAVNRITSDLTQILSM